MVDRVKRKVLLDIFASPWTLLPAAAGLSAFLMSWAVDGSAALNLLGLTGIMSGLGVFATRLIYGLEGITQKAYQYLHEEEQRKQQKALDILDERLTSDPDPRTEETLRRLRRLYDGFHEDLKAGRLTDQAHQVAERVDEVFQASVDQLQLSYDLWTSSQNLTGPEKKNVLQQREESVQEVMKTIDHLARTIEQFHSFHVKRNTSELERLRAELDETMRVARRTEERLSAMDKPKEYEPSEFES